MNVSFPTSETRFPALFDTDTDCDTDPDPASLKRLG
jgi:hypothetical protein